MVVVSKPSGLSTEALVAMSMDEGILQKKGWKLSRKGNGGEGVRVGGHAPRQRIFAPLAQVIRRSADSSPPVLRSRRTMMKRLLLIVAASKAGLILV